MGNNDYGVAYDVYVHRYYTCPRPIARDEVRLVVDLGANTGFTCLHFLTQFPKAEVIAFEPHPRHAAQCRVNLAINTVSSRVTLYEAAAGTAPGRFVLTDDGTASTILSGSTEGIPVEMVDIFPLLTGRRIDLFKMDIEGGEHAILGDPRFPKLDIARLVMEWHGDENDRDRCLAILQAIGYETEKIFDEDSLGMLWAFRNPAPGGTE
jgi:FkbM family methyltransferase